MKDEPKIINAKPKFARRLWLIALAFLVVAVIAALLIFHFIAPKRSVAAYCQIYKAEKTRLAKLPGDTWPSAVFDDTVGDASEFASSLRRMEKVSPVEIDSDIKTLQSVYQKIHDDPSQALSASLSGTTSESNVKQWTNNNCEAQ